MQVLLYNGQLDIIVGGPLTERFLQVLDWTGKEDYLKAQKKVWKIGDDVAGYIRAVGNFYQVNGIEHEKIYKIIFIRGRCSKHTQNISLHVWQLGSET